MLPTLTQEQLELARKTKKSKGRYYTDESFKNAVMGELRRLEGKLTDKMLCYFTVASFFAIKDTLEPTNEQLMEIFSKTQSTYKAFDDPNCELDFNVLRDGIKEETGIYIDFSKGVIDYYGNDKRD